MNYRTGNIIVTTIHILSAILAVGGVAFLRFVALPFAEGLPETEKDRFRQVLRKRFSPILHTSFLLLILTGIHHITRLIRAGMRIQEILILKIALALTIVFIGVALTLPRGFEGMKARRKGFLLLDIVIAVIVVFLGIWVTHR
ncbi:MAG: hypothetical protein QF593_10210 [Nitrospinota bacterium]|nr:hypothetical protein [Nitrospinota bacterium]